MTSTPTAVALLSSGLDSSVALAMAREGGYKISLALTFDYGQRAATRELLHASWIADYFKVPHKTIRLSWFQDLNTSALMRNSPTSLPKPTVSDLDSQEKCEATAKAVWVPNRNGLFIEIAAAYAESLKSDAVVAGFNSEEAQTFSDNSQAYVEAINGALKYSTGNKIKVIAPTVEMDKAGIMATARRLNMPIDLVWSCYESGSKMCGLCESCQRLRRALTSNKMDTNAYFANPA